MRGHWVRFNELELTASHALVVAAVMLAIVVVERRHAHGRDAEGTHAG